MIFLAMSLNPKAMRRAQAEVDAVVGRERLPTCSDAQHMPYVVALVRELLRWKPPAPIGMYGLYTRIYSTYRC